MAQSQIQVTGIVRDSITSEGIPFANVVVFNVADSNIIDFSITDISGKFEILDIDSTLEVVVEASILGYKKKSIVLKNENSIRKIEFRISAQNNQLEEIEIKAFKRGIIVNGDTTIYKTEIFTHGGETTIKEVLNKIPGLHVDNQGTITANGKSVKTVLIEGDDFMNHNRNAILQGISAYDVENISVIENYEASFKANSSEDHLALNIEFKEKLYNIWGGDIELAYGLKGKYQIRANPYKLNSKDKFYFNVSSANTGQNRLGVQDYVFLNGGNLSPGQSIPNIFQGRSDYASFNAQYLSTNFSVRPNNTARYKGFIYAYNTDITTSQFSKQVSESSSFDTNVSQSLNNNTPYIGSKFEAVFDPNNVTQVNISLQSSFEQSKISSPIIRITNGFQDTSQKNNNNKNYEINLKTKYRHVKERNSLELKFNVDYYQQRDSLFLMSQGMNLPISNIYSFSRDRIRQTNIIDGLGIGIGLEHSIWNDFWQASSSLVIRHVNQKNNTISDVLSAELPPQERIIRLFTLKERIEYASGRWNANIDLPLILFNMGFDHRGEDSTNAIKFTPVLKIRYEFNPFSKISMDYLSDWENVELKYPISTPIIINSITELTADYDPLKILIRRSLRVQFRNQDTESGHFYNAHVRYSLQENPVINNIYLTQYQQIKYNIFDSRRGWDAALFFSKKFYTTPLGIRGYTYWRKYDTPKQLNGSEYNELTYSTFGQLAIFTNWSKGPNISYQIEFSQNQFKALSNQIRGSEVSNSIELNFNTFSMVKEFRWGVKNVVQRQNVLMNPFWNIYGRMAIGKLNNPWNMFIEVDNVLNLNTLESVISRNQGERYYITETSALPGYIIMGVNYSFR